VVVEEVSKNTNSQNCYWGRVSDKFSKQKKVLESII
jgi:hypothetical protein